MSLICSMQRFSKSRANYEQPMFGKSDISNPRLKRTFEFDRSGFAETRLVLIFLNLRMDYYMGNWTTL